MLPHVSYLFKIREMSGILKFERENCKLKKKKTTLGKNEVLDLHDISFTGIMKTNSSNTIKGSLKLLSGKGGILSRNVRKFEISSLCQL